MCYNPSMHAMEEALAVIRRHGGIARTRDLLCQGIHPRTIAAMVESGAVLRISRGLYQFVDADPQSMESLATATVAVPRGVVCLLTALVFHELTTQNPPEIYMAVERNSWRSKVDYPPIRIFTMSGDSFGAGIIEETIAGLKVRLYDAEKTICDCFKFRSIVGEDIAIEALKDWLRRPGRDIEKLLSYARICRVESLVRRYLQAML